jgi:hypothetical protein
MRPRGVRRLRSTENMSGPGIGVGDAVLGDQPAYRNASKIVEQRPHRLPDGATHVLEIDIDADRARGFESADEVARAMIHAGVKPNSSATKRHLSGPPAMPTARHPLILAICPTTEPTAPDAVATATVSPAFGRPISRIRLQPPRALSKGRSFALRPGETKWTVRT